MGSLSTFSTTDMMALRTRLREMAEADAPTVAAGAHRIASLLREAFGGRLGRTGLPPGTRL